MIWLALQLGRTPTELEHSLTYVEKLELLAWCRINGPLPIQRPMYFAGQVVAAIHNSNLTRETSHLAKSPADFLLFGEKPDTTEADLIRAMGQLGIPLRTANDGKH